MLEPMRAASKRLPALLLLTTLVAAVGACGGSATRKDTRRLKNKCGLVHGNPVSTEGARCIAKLWGIKDSKRCPMQVALIEGYPEPVYRAHESCSGLGVLVAGSTGRVLAMVSGDEVLYPPVP